MGHYVGHNNMTSGTKMKKRTELDDERMPTFDSNEVEYSRNVLYSLPPSTSPNVFRSRQRWLPTMLVLILCIVGLFGDRKLILYGSNSTSFLEIMKDSTSGMQMSSEMNTVTADVVAVASTGEQTTEATEVPVLASTTSPTAVPTETSTNTKPTAVPRVGASTSTPTAVPRVGASTITPTAGPRVGAGTSTPTVVPRVGASTNTPTTIPRVGASTSTPTIVPRVGASTTTQTTVPFTHISTAPTAPPQPTATLPANTTAEKNEGDASNTTSNTNNQIESEEERQRDLERRRTPFPHPHAGARDSDGYFGYVADVTRLRRWMIDTYCSVTNATAEKSEVAVESRVTFCRMPFATDQEYGTVCNEEVGKGYEGYEGGWDIVAKILAPINESISVWNSTTTSDEEPLPPPSTTLRSSSPSVLCAIYTLASKHDTSIRAIVETWGWRCDGFFVASTKTISTFNMSNVVNDAQNSKYNSNYTVFPPGIVEMIDLVHEGEEIYGNMWQKTRSIVSYMHDNYLDKFDYFYLCGDDTHLIVENLKLFLREQEDKIDAAATATSNNTNNGTSPDDKNNTKVIYTFFSGQVLRTHRVYVGGGGGYVISRNALRMFVDKAIPTCYVHARVAAEDRFFSNCMKDILGITVTDAADAVGKQRFNGVSPGWMAIGRGENGFFKPTLEYWGSIHGFKSKKDLVSTKSIAFHMLKTVKDMKRHHAILYSKVDVIVASADNATSSSLLSSVSLITKGCPLGTKVGDALAVIYSKQTNILNIMNSYGNLESNSTTNNTKNETQ